MKKFLCSLLLAAAAGCASSASAQIIMPTAIAGPGLPANGFNLSARAVISAEGGVWKTSSTGWWFQNRANAIRDVGFRYRTKDALTSLDRDGFYKVDFSLDRLSYGSSFRTLTSRGDITPRLPHWKR